MVGLGHHRRLAGDRIAQHAEAVLGADHERVEAVEIVERCFSASPRLSPLLHAPGEIAGGHFGVVVGLEAKALALELRRSALWLDSEPLCTRHWSAPVEKGCAPSVVTADSVAMRVWPMP